MVSIVRDEGLRKYLDTLAFSAVQRHVNSKIIDLPLGSPGMNLPHESAWS